MKTLYTKDKNVRVSFRLDGKLSEWIVSRSAELGVTPSAFIRNIVYQNFYTESVLARIGTGEAGAQPGQNRKVVTNANIKAH